MKIEIYAPHRWSNVRPLLQALRETWGRDVKLLRNPNVEPEGDGLINWGGIHSTIANLNSRLPINKHKELSLMKAAGVLVPVFAAGISDIPIREIGYEVGQMMPRSLHHRAAADLLSHTHTTGAALYVQRVPVEHEFRIHVFRPHPAEDRWLSIRAGLKVKVREDAHPWIRTLGQGWNTDYGEACMSILRDYSIVRDAAKAAVKAVGLDFGAVDVGLSGGYATVFEVNGAPGLANAATAAAYARHINKRIPSED